MFKTEYVKTHFDEMADQVAKGLALHELQLMLEELVFHSEKISSEIILAYGRFASNAQIEKLITQMNKWKSYGEFGATGRKQIIVARGALMLSDSREAMLAIDKVKALEYYASLRGTDEITIRDRVLSDFNFDNKGKRTLDLGDNKVIISLSDDLSLTIYDQASGKSVKSIPKKNANPDLYNQAKAEYAEMKKNIKKVVSGRSKLLFEEFLSRKEYEYRNWSDMYIDNVVLKAVGCLIVWKQGANCFVLDRTGAALDVKGNSIKLTKEPIIIAHPMEMDKNDIALWQCYFLKKGLKQPFEQIWEPAYDLKNIKRDRFNGYTIPVLKTTGKEKDGIIAWGVGVYSEEYGFDLKDCEIEYDTDTQRMVPGVTNDAKYILGNIKILECSRYANHMIYLLDKWTIQERIAKNDISVMDILDSFTMAQIVEFIDIAQESCSYSVLAQLLEYKNKKYADYDPMDRFILDLS